MTVVCALKSNKTNKQADETTDTHGQWDRRRSTHCVCLIESVLLLCLCQSSIKVKHQKQAEKQQKKKKQQQQQQQQTLLQSLINERDTGIMSACGC
ncbi:hypothetical protein AWZ03_001855 [Drosophila navojoa]|uniref:Uncharacterized protein n=1 Tax=Drosophila navojoa TaxID=7232 RepID=A0A484BV51_DRONA|nr:hypothetical protein AWZ03_001855 [Drosophila navojoa]